MSKNTASRKSHRTHQFSQVPQATIPRSSFDRSSGLKTTLNGGYLVPIYLDEVLPGDTFQMKASLFGRLATPLKPVLENIWLETFWFFVPNRLVWDNWEKFLGAQDNPGDSTDYTIPTTGTAGYNEMSLMDYLGLPTKKSVGHSVLPIRGYQLIWNEFFRDQNLQQSAAVSTADGPDFTTALTLQKRGKRHDYYTSCLPFPQKGDPVTVPLGDQAPIFTRADTDGQDIFVGEGDNYTTATRLNSHATTRALQYEEASGDVQVSALNLYADLASATGFTINQLRESFQIQRLLERDARGGTRHVEILKSHFGVTAPDFRLQRPEFLGGGRSAIQINPVPQTVADTNGPDERALGALAAYGTVSGSGHGFTKSFVEHGYVFGLANIRADITYQEGLDRFWSRSTRFDFYWPALSRLGEMAVLNKEIWYADDDTVDNDVFGYQEAYGDYRFKKSTVTGLLRSNSNAALDSWHLALDFADTPVLGSDFIEDNPPFGRIQAVLTEPHMLLDVYFKLRCARPMPMYGIPGMIDHF